MSQDPDYNPYRTTDGPVRQPTYGPGGPPQAAGALQPSSAPHPDADALFADLLQTPEVKEAFEGGRGRRLERILRRRRKETADPLQRSQFDELLRRRRLFAERITSAPPLTTINGIGPKIYGKSDFDPGDGTYVTTLWLVLLFIPVFPIRQYLVRHAGGNQYSFFATVPPAGWLRLWRKAVLAAGLLLAVGLVGTALADRAYPTVHFVNGLDVPATVKLGSVTVDLAGNSHEGHRVTTGKQHAQVLVAGRVVDEQDVNIVGGYDVVAYNVLGAAPLINEQVVYSNTSRTPQSDSDAEGNYELFAGQRLVLCASTEHVFETPPSQISMDARQSRTTRSYFRVLDGGWKTAVDVLMGAERLAQAAMVARDVALVEPDQPQALGAALTLMMRSGNREGCCELARALLARQPDDIDMHRLFQHQMVMAGHKDQVLAEYRKQAQDQPGSVTAAYLRARLEPAAEAMRLYGELSAKYPDNEYIIRGYGWLLFQSRQFERALPWLEKAAKIKTYENYSDIHGMIARSLIALGKPQEALARVMRHCDTHSEALDFDWCLLVGRLVQRSPNLAAGRPADYYLAKIHGERTKEMEVLFAARLGLPEPRARPGDKIEPQLAEAARIVRLAETDLGAAASAAARSTDEILYAADDLTLFLLAGKLAVQNQEKDAGRILEMTSPAYRITPEMKEFVLKEHADPDIHDIDLEYQAAIHLIQAMRAAKAGHPTADLVKQALEDDVLPGLVTRIAKSQFK